MLLNIKNIKIIVIAFLITILFSNKSDYDLFYNYHILNSSPITAEFNHLLENDYESELIHLLNIKGIPTTLNQDYERFLNQYYQQYKKENLKFINAIVEPDIFYVSGLIGMSNIIIGENNYAFGKTMGFHIDSPYAFKILKKIIVIGLKSSITSLPPSNSLNWDNFQTINMVSTYSMKFWKSSYALTGLGLTLNSNNSGSNILPLISLGLAYELPWKPLNIPFDITLCSSTSWDLKNIHIGFNILLSKPYEIKLEI